MASPQIENGFTSVANEIMEVISRARFTQYQFRIVVAILRNSYGVLRRKAARVSYGYLSVQCHLQRQHVVRTVRELVALNVVTKKRIRRAPQNQLEPHQAPGASPGITLALNKDWERWKPGLIAPPLLLLDGSVPEPLEPDEAPLLEPDQVPNKEIKKEERKKPLANIKLARWMYSKILLNHPSAHTPKWSKWEKDLEGLIRIDKHSRREVIRVFIWATRDDFWKANMRSPANLRKNYDRFKIRMNQNGKLRKGGYKGDAIQRLLKSNGEGV